MKIFSIIGVLCWVALFLEYDWTLALCWLIATTAVSVWVYSYCARKDRERQTTAVKKLEGMLNRLAAELDGKPELSERELEADNKPLEEEIKSKLPAWVFYVSAVVLIVALLVWSFLSEINHAIQTSIF
jgi:Ca2+/H+ antiporter